MGRESPTPDRVASMDNSPPGLTAATTADVVVIVVLMNLVFRGGGSDAGWITEADHFQGNRTQ
jgi:hypothetical protein